MDLAAVQGSRPMVDYEGHNELEVIAQEIVADKITVKTREPGSADEEFSAGDDAE